ncbi:hypothetical protein CRYUN_Cryun26dG0090300 [Craigia yunnanensis]
MQDLKVTTDAAGNRPVKLINPRLKLDDMPGSSGIMQGLMRVSCSKNEPLKVMISGAQHQFGLVHISTGDLLRAEISSGTETKEFMNAGHLVPDEIVTAMVTARLSFQDAKEKGCLLDGYPRSFSQAQSLEELNLRPDIYIVLDDLKAMTDAAGNWPDLPGSSGIMRTMSWDKRLEYAASFESCYFFRLLYYAGTQYPIMGAIRMTYPYERPTIDEINDVFLGKPRNKDKKTSGICCRGFLSGVF